MPTFASLFSGFRGADIGAQSAGFDLAWAVEYDPAIAEVGAQLPGKMFTMDLLDADPATFDRVDALHASPPCPNYSVAKSNRTETDLDTKLAQKVCEFIRTLLPRIFTLENVYAYRKGQAWRMIEETLHECGYSVDWFHANAADFGVPQTRKRMIVRAVRDCPVPDLPEREPWAGWYQAIADLIPTLPESKFANWQLARLPAELQSSFGCLAEGQNVNGGSDRLDYQPAQTVTVAHPPMAFIVDGTNGRGSEVQPISIRNCDEPFITVTATSNKGMARAFIVGQNYGSPNDTGKDRKLNIRQSSDPVFTVETNVNRLNTRAWLSAGRVVSMTPRALARFQSFPDWFELPSRNVLACKGIGNACPPLEMEKIYRSLLPCLEPAQ